MFFHKLKQMEHDTGALYRYVSRKTANTDAELSRLFDGLAQEESVHESRVELTKNILTQMPEDVIHPDALQRIERTLIFIKEKQHILETDVSNLTDVTVMNIALNIETQLENNHKALYLDIQDHQVRELMKNLSAYDTAHP